MPAVLPARPNVKPVRVGAKLKRKLLNADPKEVEPESGSTVARPVLVIDKLAGVLNRSARTVMLPD